MPPGIWRRKLQAGNGWLPDPAPFQNRPMRLPGTLAPLAASLALAGGSLPGLCADTPPNVVLIFTDDQGTADLGCYGSPDLETPHLDALARRGVRFTQFYSAAPVCSPSRAALLTGRYPQRAGVPGNVSSQPGRPGMPASQRTLAEVMKAAGYATAHIGKWHLGYTPDTMPNAQGFDHSFGHMGGCIDNWSHFFYWSGPNRHDLWRNGQEIWADGRFFPDLMVAEAREFIRSSRGRPFFLYWAINLPHYPLQGTGRWRERYAHLPSPRREYAAFASTMDQSIGELLAILEEEGIGEDTLVVFQSDHGHSTEERSFGGGGSAGIYRGAKFSLFEGGIRVPAIASWPGRLPRNEVRHQLATAIDWLPTIAELCGIPLEHAIDGRSLVPILDSDQAPDRHPVFHWATGRDQWAVRKGPWKLIGNPRDTSGRAPLGEGDRRFLVDLGEDPSETTNLAARHPRRVEELEALHEAWKRASPPR